MLDEDADVPDSRGRSGIEVDTEVGTGAEYTPLKRYAGIVLAAFAGAGLCIGLASTVTLGFLIEQFVDPGNDPTNNTLVGIMLVHGIVTPFLLGPVVALGAGVAVGRALPDRNFAATAVGGVTSAAGFYVMVGLALALTVLTVQLYSPPGGGGSSPFSPDALLSTVLSGGIPAAIAGAVGGAVGSRLH